MCGQEEEGKKSYTTRLNLPGNLESMSGGNLTSHGIDQGFSTSGEITAYL